MDNVAGDDTKAQSKDANKCSAMMVESEQLTKEKNIFCLGKTLIRDMQILIVKKREGRNIDFTCQDGSSLPQSIIHFIAAMFVCLSLGWLAQCGSRNHS